ncbi:acyltransferase family protein [Streptomyces djakartensis]|uniref:Acyltransferase n=1 Tax=Streptomyces djakartensis TaxID=68193 RepID=A0ABQ3ABN7_9ACTN|nr:acyltransferase [Streptomyces djakartensis]GGY45872.1 acyltransferase [Streptomyces djakartensis]
MESRVERLPSLTGLRWFAALSVFVCHIAQQGISAGPDVAFGLGHLTSLGSLAVSLFFVLSGYVLTWSARDGDSVKSFWRRRFAKIYPLHFVTFCIAAVIIFGLSEPVLPGGSAWDGMVPNLLLHSWLPDAYIVSGFSTPSWSLSCEMAFYLTFPLWYRLLRGTRASQLWWYAAGLALAVACMPFVARLLPDSAEVVPGMPLRDMWFTYWYPPVRMLEFLLGIVLALIRRQGAWRGPGTGTAALLLGGAFALNQVVPPMFTLTATTVVPIALLIAAVADGDLRGRRTGLRVAVLVRLGAWSYAFYLIHFLIIRYGHRLLGGDQGYARQWDTLAALGITAAALGVTIAASAVPHIFAERPCMTLSRGRRPPQGPAPDFESRPHRAPLERV